MKRPLPGRHRSLGILLAGAGMLGVASAALAGPPNWNWDKSPLRLEASVGYTRDTEAGAPEGSIGAQLGLHKEFIPRWEVGVVGGYWDLGQNNWVDDLGEPQSVDYSAWVAWGQVGYNFASPGQTKFMLSGGAGAYNKRLDGFEDCDCTDFGMNLGLGIRTAYPGKKFNLGADVRYHLLPREDNSGSKFLSLMGTAMWDIGGGNQ